MTRRVLNASRLQQEVSRRIQRVRIWAASGFVLRNQRLQARVLPGTLDRAEAPSAIVGFFRDFRVSSFDDLVQTVSELNGRLEPPRLANSTWKPP